MVAPGAALSTVRFIDHDCAVYQDRFADVRSFEAFKFLPLGIVSAIARKWRPAIARAVG